ncbi:MAG: biotin/lipoyl-containing protein [Acidobacteriota bacterium]
MKALAVYVLRERDGAPQEIHIESGISGLVASYAGIVERFEAAALPDGRVSLLFEDGRQFCGRARPAATFGIEMWHASGRRPVRIADPLRDRIAHAAEEVGSPDEEEEFRALMPGRVIEIKVAEGDRVEAGQLLLVIEAMKMHNEIRCDRPGVVASVEVSTGQLLEGGALLVIVRPGSDGSSPGSSP